jgi:hypothetical protein
MGFFSLLETFFFISLAITFILIIMLVYHFKGRLVTLEDKCNTMFEIMNSMVKEMKNIRESIMTAAPPQPPAAVPFAGASGLFPPELFKLFQGGPSMFPSQRNNVEGDDEDDEYEGDDDEDEEDEEEQEYKKIVVSDTELDSDVDEEDDVKIISVNIDDNVENTPVSLADLEEEENLLDNLEIDEDEDEEINDLEDETNEIEDDEKKSEADEDPIKLEISNEPTDYRKLDVSFLRTMVITRGLATDTKKMKKQDLIRLLEQSA